jgi:hypothetical protein
MAIHPELNEEIVWPSELRSLHGEGADWRQTASLGWNRGDWYTRIRGFRTAAELLARYVAENRTEQDGLIYPFLYNWRQHIELALKQLIVEAEKLLDITAKPPSGHNLEVLWTRCRSLFEQANHGEKDELDNVSATLAELHAMDPVGVAFRYPRALDGSVTLPTVDRLSFERINTALVATANLLEAAEMGISVQLEQKEDFEREFSDYGY